MSMPYTCKATRVYIVGPSQNTFVNIDCCYIACALKVDSIARREKTGPNLRWLDWALQKLLRGLSVSEAFWRSWVCIYQKQSEVTIYSKTITSSNGEFR